LVDLVLQFTLIFNQLDEIGFYPFVEDLIRTIVVPFSKTYFPHEKPFQFDAHHSFIVRYKVGEDIDLAKHVDDSEVTVNVCLGKEFEGTFKYIYQRLLCVYICLF
jgi:hypothetical protein